MPMYGHAGPGAMLGTWAIFLNIQMYRDMLLLFRQSQTDSFVSSLHASEEIEPATKDVERAVLTSGYDAGSESVHHPAADEWRVEDISILRQAQEYIKADSLDDAIAWVMIVGGLVGIAGEVGDGLYWGNTLWQSFTQQNHGVHIPAYVAASLCGYFLLKYRVHDSRLGRQQAQAEDTRDCLHRRRATGGFRHYEIVFWMFPPMYDALLGALIWFHKQHSDTIRLLHGVMACELEVLAVVFFLRRLIEYRLVQQVVDRPSAIQVRQLMNYSMGLKWVMAYMSAVNAVWFFVVATVTVPGLSLLEPDGEDTDVTMWAVKYSIFSLLLQLGVTAACLNMAERKANREDQERSLEQMSLMADP